MIVPIVAEAEVEGGKYLDVVKAPIEGVIVLGELPESIRNELLPLDLNGDGTIDVAEVVALRDKETAEKETSKTYKKLLFLFIFAWILQIIAVFGVSFIAADMNRPYDVDNGNTMVSKDNGEPMATQNSDMCIIAGAALIRNADGSCPDGDSTDTIMTSVATDAVYLTSDYTDDFFHSLLTVNIPTPDGGLLKFNTIGFGRNGTDESVMIYFSAGYLMVTDTAFTCHDYTNMGANMCANAGYEQDVFYAIEPLRRNRKLVQEENARRRLYEDSSSSEEEGGSSVSGEYDNDDHRGGREDPRSARGGRGRNNGNNDREFEGQRGGGRGRGNGNHGGNHGGRGGHY